MAATNRDWQPQMLFREGSFRGSREAGNNTQNAIYENKGSAVAEETRTVDTVEVLVESCRFLVVWLAKRAADPLDRLPFFNSRGSR